MASFYIEASPIEDSFPSHVTERFPSGVTEKLQVPPPLYRGYTRDGLFPVEHRFPESDEDTLRILESPPAERVDDESWVTGWKLTSLMISITSACFLLLLDMSIIVTAIPIITTDFASLHDVGWYGSAYNLSCGALQPLSGKLYTYLNTKWTFLAFVITFELGSLMCALANNSTMLILGRAIAGMGGSGIQNGGFTIIAAAAPLEKRPALLGLVMGGCQIGLVAGPLIGGALTEYATWRWCFWINLPIGALCVLLILFVQVPDRRLFPEIRTFRTIIPKLDLPGFAIFAPCAVMFLLGLEFGGKDYPWDSATVASLFWGGAVVLMGFLWWENRVGEDAMIPLHVIRRRVVWTSCLTMLFLFTTIFTTSYYLPIYFQSIKGVSPLTSGVYMLPSIITQLVFAVVSGFLTQKIGYYQPISLVSAIVLAIGNGLLATFDPDTSTGKWVGYQLLVGFARGLGMQIPLIAVQANVEPAIVSIATALLVFGQTFGGSVFISVANAVFNGALKKDLEERLPSIDTQIVIDAGATGVRHIVPPQDLPAVLWAYSTGVDQVFYLATAGSVLMFVFSWGMGWTDIRKKKEELPNEAIHTHRNSVMC